MFDLDARAERVWPSHPLVAEDLRQRNIAEWKKAVTYLGDKWVLAKKVERKL